MAGAEETEMSMIECRKFWFVQAFNHGEYGCVDEADVRIGIPIAEVADARVIQLLQLFHRKGANTDVIEQRHKYTGV